MSELEKILKNRGKKYGDYKEMSAAICKLKKVTHDYVTEDMRPYQLHALDMIMVKVGRIITGDPNYDDNWRDIAGYATLVLDNLPQRGD